MPWFGGTDGQQNPGHTWSMVKDQMRVHFQPYGYLEVKVEMLQRRMLQQNESIHESINESIDYYNVVTQMYGSLQNLNKNYR